MDEPDEDEDETINIQDIPFVAEKSFLEKNGTSYEISLNEDKRVTLKIA